MGLSVVAALSCSSPSASQSPVSSAAQKRLAAKAPLRVRATAVVSAPCGPGSLERHATNIADLDGNGTLDRVAITRENDTLVVRLFEMPSLDEIAAWKLLPANGYVEVATPRRRDDSGGDLWITVGTGGKKPRDGAPTPWTETLYHLENGKLVAVTSGYRNMRIRVDVDGDGRVDPIGSGGGAVRALLANGLWLDLPVALSSRVHGLASSNGQQEAVDLDGNGVRELVIEREDRISIIEVPSLREVWSAKGNPWNPQLLRWAGETVLAVRLDKKLSVFRTDSTHALIAEYPKAKSYSSFVATYGSQVVTDGHPWQFFDRATPAVAIGTVQRLVFRLDGGLNSANSPYGPTRFAPGEAPGLLAVEHPPLGEMELWLVDAKTRSKERRIWKSGPLSGFETRVDPSLVDLDRDGSSEILLEHGTHTMFHHDSTWNTSRLELVDGAGKPLWMEPKSRIEEWLHEDGEFGKNLKQTRFDGTHVRAFDLGDGTMPLRVRSVRDEYYLLTGSSKLQSIPPCLE